MVSIAFAFTQSSLHALPDIGTYPISHHLLGQALPPEGIPADVELLKSQLEFLKQSYSEFVETIKIIFIVLGIAGAVAAYFFGKSFRDLQIFARENIERIHDFSETASKEAVEQVRRKAETEVAYLVEHEARDIVRAEVRNIARIVKKEQVIGTTQVDYYLPGGDREPKEVSLLRAREFGDVVFFTQLGELRTQESDVVVLDLENFKTEAGDAFAGLAPDARDAIAQPIIDDLLERLPQSSVLIVFVSYPQIRHINVVAKERYVLAANGSITLVGNAADGAYVAKGDRSGNSR